jgi:hypothetical protein
VRLVGADYLVLADAWDKTHSSTPELMGQKFQHRRGPRQSLAIDWVGSNPVEGWGGASGVRYGRDTAVSGRYPRAMSRPLFTFLRA